jgi:heme exporter protein D
VTSTNDVHVNNGTNGTTWKQVWVNESVNVEFNGTFSTDLTGEKEGSKDYNGTIRAWQWDFNDNLSKKDKKDHSNKTNGSAVTHRFAVNGTYNVTLNVTDAAGNYAIINITVYVNDTTKPVGIIEMWSGKSNLTSNPQAIENKSYEFRAWRSYDPNFGEIVNYTWWFPDDGTLIKNETHGKSGKGIENVTHVFKKTGTFKVALNLTDKRNNSMNTTITVVVGKQPRPDLMLKNLSFNPEHLEVGVSTSVSVNVSNIKRGTIKTANATDVTIKFYVDGAETASVKVSKTLKPCEENKATKDCYEVVEFQWIPQQSGNHIVKVQAETPQENLPNGDNSGEHPNDMADSKIEQEVNIAPATWSVYLWPALVITLIVVAIVFYFAWSRKKWIFSEEARTLRKKRKEEEERRKQEEKEKEEKEKEEKKTTPQKKEEKKPVKRMESKEE